MGNLQQEHNFQTSDTPGGLGIAQWLGGRRDRLMQRPGYDTLQVQLEYLVWELENTENMANYYLKMASSVEEASTVFENLYERCNPVYCMRNQRVAYANAIYAEFNKQ